MATDKRPAVIRLAGDKIAELLAKAGTDATVWASIEGYARLAKEEAARVA